MSRYVQKIAINFPSSDSGYQQQNDRQKLIRSMLNADTPWQKVDYET
ncbi:hypothetical protein H6G97_36290 [Nostoc flagelliforme FACHB-838]|uniref:Transposase n=1 Tax=Nostoc flagelliforme FACHB-838 TaxID=2692904 RepID=A0ABR8E261_9NOSO|nr:hypothetical protein [Nostoc flagelliforme]MBD2534645.1 hypothetical protein [Nostoc flagelliforme FACHB-838]